MKKSIVHIGVEGTFLYSFVAFVNKNFNSNYHLFLLTTNDRKRRYPDNVALANRDVLARLLHYLNCIVKMNRADKVVLHGLFDIKLVLILFFMPWLLKKCYWVIWGGDLYAYKRGGRSWGWKLREIFRRPVIRNVGYLVTYIPGDVDRARSWYSARGEYLECLMYTSNVVHRAATNFNSSNNETHDCSSPSLLVGNSSDPSNNHVDVLKKLRGYSDKISEIVVPLSYGHEENAKKVIAKGNEWFAEKFTPLTQLMEYESYLQVLDRIDIAIFNHDRQQAMGNTITLLALGKTIYMRSTVSQYSFLQSLGLAIMEIDSFNMQMLSAEDASKNVELVNSFFSSDNLKAQLEHVFEV